MVNEKRTTQSLLRTYSIVGTTVSELRQRVLDKNLEEGDLVHELDDITSRLAKTK